HPGGPRHRGRGRAGDPRTPGRRLRRPRDRRPGRGRPRPPGSGAGPGAGAGGMRPRAWMRELLLGARMALAGGVSGWLRAGLTALGVGLGVALLLLAASVPHAIAARQERTAARDDVSYGEPP